jgi:hypothetical protein
MNCLKSTIDQIFDHCGISLLPGESKQFVAPHLARRRSFVVWLFQMRVPVATTSYAFSLGNRIVSRSPLYLSYSAVLEIAFVLLVG